MTLEDVARMLPKYRTMALYFTKNDMFADDVMQNLFIKLAVKYEKEGSLDFIKYKDGLNDSYIFLMIRSCFTDLIRKELKYSDTEADFTKMTVDEVEPDLLSSHLKGLNFYDKKLTEIYFNEEHTIRSLAKATKISATNIYLTLKKTKAVIKNNIEMDLNHEINEYVKHKTGRKEKVKAGTKAKGLGDTIENITKATGIKALVDKFTPEGKDCGCDKRKELLNKLFPYKAVKCMTEEQYNTWKDALTKIEKNRVQEAELKTIAALHADLFGHKYHEPCRCSPKDWLYYMKQINKIYDTYES